MHVYWRELLTRRCISLRLHAAVVLLIVVLHHDRSPPPLCQGLKRGAGVIRERGLGALPRLLLALRHRRAACRRHGSRGRRRLAAAVAGCCKCKGTKSVGAGRRFERVGAAGVARYRRDNRKLQRRRGLGSGPLRVQRIHRSTMRSQEGPKGCHRHLLILPAGRGAADAARQRARHDAVGLGVFLPAPPAATLTLPLVLLLLLPLQASTTLAAVMRPTLNKGERRRQRHHRRWWWPGPRVKPCGVWCGDGVCDCCDSNTARRACVCAMGRRVSAGTTSQERTTLL